MLMAKEQFKHEMRDMLNKHLTLANPLFRHLMDANNPNPELLKFTTLQGYQLTKHFLTYIEYIYFYCPIEKHKRILLHNMYEEETGALSRTKNHVELLHDFIRALGISDAERDAATPLPATQQLIDYRMHACQNPELYHIAAAAVLIASEGQNLETLGEEARHSILGRIYQLKEEDLLFFSVHQKEDVGHVKQGLALVTDLCITEEMQQQALAAIERTCQYFYAMYQGIYEHLKLNELDLEPIQ
ncbi:pyrroloquinoline quinone (Coenzyme PQQ) biosynthesis protein C [Gynuella sunshinyii YC6258]|uniref:Pyrroloquinoline quinone (Coenzyme PQQ) biosynthesis protein C n=2 Tax=Gynuella sunshinyii TaxID=1445505 RepID=A0A0C5VDQ9_9GAMM|nr:pyrroloquinoline quinone (Coenzyme PQQ) biosynthesis protein C [Gynuella sunshinyii YC6258]